MDDGSAMVWAEDGSRSAVRKLVRSLCVNYPGIIDGNKLGAATRDFMDRFGQK
jgi:hypothetical protein